MVEEILEQRKLENFTEVLRLYHLYDTKRDMSKMSNYVFITRYCIKTSITTLCHSKTTKMAKITTKT